MTDREQTERRMVVDEALSWLGTPYHHRGTVKGAGVDCGGLLFEVFSAVGLIPHRLVPEHKPDFHLHQGDEWYLAELQSYCTEVQTAQPGDIIMYRYGRVIAHSAIVIDFPQIIHAYTSVGVLVDHAINNADLAKRQAAIFSYWGRS